MNIRQVNNKMEEQIFAAISEGLNVFVTGKAGTGKSTLLRKIINTYQSKVIFSVAPTGIAAMNIGGMTFHSYLGIRPNEETVEQMLGGTKFNATVKNRLCETDMLVIDEISMISGDFFENASSFVRQVRQRQLGAVMDSDLLKKPFGGIQVVMFGDFFQLPPIIKKVKSKYVDDVPCKFAFECSIWDQLAERTFVLQEVYRQQGDLTFTRILGNIRECNLYKSDIVELAQRQKQQTPDDIIRLVCVNEFARKINQMQLAKLPQTPSFKFVAVFKGHVGICEDLKKDLEQLELMEITYKPGARVMLRRNVDQSRKLVNGSLGVVQGVDALGCLVVKMDEHEEPIAFPPATWVKRRKAANMAERRIADREGFIQGEVKQMPFTFAWAISIHKSQGITLSKAEVDLDRCFEDHQAYVALSRLTSLDGLYLKNFTPDKIRVNKKVKAFYKQAILKDDLHDGSNLNNRDEFGMVL